MNFTASLKPKFKNINEDRVRDNTILLQAGLLISVLTSILFFLQALTYGGRYMSDLPAHINQAMFMANYSVIFLLMKWLLVFTRYTIYSVALLEGCTIGFAFICTALTIEKLFSLDRYRSMLASFFLLFLTNIYIPVLFPRFYLGSLISQPWHNMTYNAMRPFAALTMLFFGPLHEIYRKEKRISWKYWILTCVMLVIATSLKPNFLMGFAPALLVFLLIDFFGKRNTFKNEFLLGCVVLPAIAVLPIQAHMLFDGMNGIVFAPSIFFFDDGPMLFFSRFLASMPLAVMVYFYNRHRLENGAGVAAWAHVWAVLEGMFIMEDGPRQTHGNFLWGLYITGYILYLYVYAMFFRNIREYRSGEAARTKGSRIYLIAGIILMVLHVASGLYYFRGIIMGEYIY